MAREKMPSYTADDAALCEEERAVPSASKRSATPAKKKVSNKRSNDATGDGNGESNGAHSAASRKGSSGTGSGTSHNGKGSTTQTRGNKTLGWYLNDGILRNLVESHSTNNKSVVESSPSPPATMTVAVAKESQSQRTKGSKWAPNDEEKKRGKRARQRQSKKVVDVKGTADSQDSEEVTEGKPVLKNDYKDDYWYYDPSSDGYYYEQMGSRGWRRRAPVGEQKRLQMEQELYNAMLRDPSGALFAQLDPFGYNIAAAANSPFFVPQVKYYDAASDGYYFEMPSVDGWKKRQPSSNSNSNSNSGTSSNSSSYKSTSSVPSFARAVLASRDMSHTTSYGAALARGQLPPACTIAPDVSANNQDPFSSGASSLSALSSLSEGTPTPPPQSSAGRGSLFVDEDGFDDFLAEQYERALELEELLNDESDVDDCGDEIAPMKHATNSTHKKHQTTYADVAAASSCHVDDTEKAASNKTPHERPGTLQLHAPILDSAICEKETGKDGHELLLNFNADKFIEDIALCGTNPERILRDLAALKTPVAPSSQVCSVDSPHTPAVNTGGFPNWARSAPASDTVDKSSDDWWRLDIGGTYIEDLWPKDSVTYSSSKSKLSIWRDAGLFTGVTVNNN